MKKKINEILESIGFKETSDLLWTKNVTRTGPTQIAIINGVRKEMPGRSITVEFRVSVFINNFWLDEKGEEIQPGFYLVQISTKTGDNIQEGFFDMIYEKELDKLKDILKGV